MSKLIKDKLQLLERINERIKSYEAMIERLGNVEGCRVRVEGYIKVFDERDDNPRIVNAELFSDYFGDLRQVLLASHDALCKERDALLEVFSVTERLLKH